MCNWVRSNGLKKLLIEIRRNPKIKVSTFIPINQLMKTNLRHWVGLSRIRYVVLLGWMQEHA